MRQLSFETNFRDSLFWEIGRPDVRNELVLDVVYFETAFSSARAWSIWSYA